MVIFHYLLLLTTTSPKPRAFSLFSPDRGIFTRTEPGPRVGSEGRLPGEMAVIDHGGIVSASAEPSFFR